MSKVKISREELEKFIKEQFDVEEVKWQNDGSVTIDIDMEKLKKRTIEVHRHYYPYTYPVYIGTTPLPEKRLPYWTISTKTNASNLCFVNTK